MFVSIPPHFKPVETADFEAYLKTCPDYLRDGFSNLIRYRFKHNNFEFAVVEGEPGSGKEKVHVSPAVMKQQPQ